MSKRKTPYDNLLEEAREFGRAIQFRHTQKCWTYPKDKIDSGWGLADLMQHVSAAKKLGYETHLYATDAGLEVVFVKSVQVPWRFKS
jgi:hypothetical protein